jgi:hypothetical protein
MIQNGFKKLFLTILILSPILAIYGVMRFQLTNAPFDKGPWVSWYDSPSTEVYIGWEREIKHTGEVRYGKDAANLNLIEVDLVEKHLHHVNLTNLEPNTKYFYQIYTNSEFYRDGEFMTAPADATTPFTFGMISDTQQIAETAPSYSEYVARAIAEQEYRFLGIVGDFVDTGDEQFYWDSFFSQARHYLDKTALVPVIGNHDDRGGNESRFGDYFINDRGISVYNHFFYSFNYSMVHFTICHFPYASEEEVSAEQLAWLEQDLKNSQGVPFRVVMFHAPIKAGGFFSPNHRLIDKVLPLMYQYRVSVIFNGHEHHYERGFYTDAEKQWSDGHKVMYMLLGCGGSLFDPFVRVYPEADVIRASPSMTTVECSITSLQFTTKSPEGAILDTFTLRAE